MPTLALKIAYWAGLILEMVIRAPYAKQAKSAAKTEQRISPVERIIFGLLTLGGFILPLVYTFTGWFDFADYHLPAWMGWLGLVFLAVSVYLFYRGHHDLRSNWSPSLEIYAEHQLITGGIYRYIRHPMYASQWVMTIAQILLLQNWLAGPVGLLCFIPFYFLRVPAEEKMMLEIFGQEYRRYMQNVGGIIPKFSKN